MIATLTERLAAPPTALPAPRTWPRLDPASDEYRRVKFSATFDHAKEALVYAAASAFRPDVSGPGYWVFTPARLADGGFVMVNRGFVPEARKDAASRADGQIAGPVEIVGVMRWPDARHWFSPADDPAHNFGSPAIRRRSPPPRAWARSRRSMSSRNRPVPPGGLPQPGKLVVQLPNEHLQYAVTWYGLALVLVVVFVVWARSSMRARQT